MMLAVEKCVALARGLDLRVTAPAIEAEDNALDLPVMDGLDHPQLGGHVWDGVTSTVINQPPCWVMLSH